MVTLCHHCGDYAIGFCANKARQPLVSELTSQTPSWGVSEASG